MSRISFAIVVVVAVCLSACGQSEKKDAAPAEAATANATEEAGDKAKKAPDAKKPAEDAAANADKGEAKAGEVVFDPRKPPAGYVNCHRNHCHKVGGGVASCGSCAMICSAQKATRSSGRLICGCSMRLQRTAEDSDTPLMTRADLFD